MRRLLQRLFNPPATPVGEPFTESGRSAESVVPDSIRIDPDDDLQWMLPPRDVRHSEIWDKYWQGQIDHGLGPATCHFMCFPDQIGQALHDTGLLTVLCVGSGLSQEPWAYAKAGYHVTVLELSPLAAREAQAMAAHPVDHLTFVVGDLMDGELCPGPYDMVLERRTLQLFPDDERLVAADRLAKRLAPRGLFVSHMHDGCGRPGRVVHALTPWIRDRQWRQWNPGEPLHGRAVWLITTTG